MMLVPLLLQLQLLLNDLTSSNLVQHQDYEHGRAFPTKKLQHVVLATIEGRRMYDDLIVCHIS